MLAFPGEMPGPWECYFLAGARAPPYLEILLKKLPTHLHAQATPAQHPPLRTFSLVSLPVCSMSFPGDLRGSLLSSVRTPLHRNLFREAFPDCSVQAAHSPILP